MITMNTKFDVRHGCSNLTNFNGRAPRKQYWLMWLVALLLVLAVQIITMLVIPHLLPQSGSTLNVLAWIMFNVFVLCACMLAVTARRFQDHGWSGEWFKWMFYLNFTLPLMAIILMSAIINITAISYSVLFVVYASLVWTFWIGFVRSDPNANQYGPPPYAFAPNEVPQ